MKYAGDVFNALVNKAGWDADVAAAFLDSIPDDKSVEEVVRCKDCIHAVDIQSKYVKELFIEGTKACECGRGDLSFGESIIWSDGFCDSGERRKGNDM